MKGDCPTIRREPLFLPVLIADGESEAVAAVVGPTALTAAPALVREGPPVEVPDSAPEEGATDQPTAVVRDITGNLRRDSGNGKGSFGSRTKTATGWKGYEALP